MSKIVKFTNCRLLRDSKLIVDDLWVRDGKILDPQNIFFDEQRVPDKIVDCSGQIVAPGFLDIQINGGYGIDFSYNTEQIEEGVALVAKHLIEHGVTGFCPTLVTSPSNMYRTILPRIKKSKGGKHGAAILGVHAEGPFISPQKKGAHPIECIKNFDEGFKSVEETYGYLEDIKIVTIAPEKENSKEIIKELVERDIVVSLGHSTADLNMGEIGCQNGARLITHLFNAMLPFHHRDPGLVGLLTSDKIQKPMYFGLISDGIHTHPAALRIAYRTHPEGLILVTDAISALGLNEGFHKLGQLAIEIRDKKAFISNTDTLCGSIATLNECVQIFHRETNCGIVYALEAASLHPAQVLQLKNKGTLNYGADADLIIVDDDLLVHSTWIDGECVFLRKECCSK